MTAQSCYESVDPGKTASMQRTMFAPFANAS